MGVCASRRRPGTSGQSSADAESILGLDQATYKGTKAYVFSMTVGKVVKVYDGDTVWVASSAEARHSCRLYGIDCPEMRGSTPEEREAAKAARDCLANELVPEDGVVGVRVLGADKYGRLLVRLSTSQYFDLSQELMRRGHAVPYDGGTKAAWRFDG